MFIPISAILEEDEAISSAMSENGGFGMEPAQATGLLENLIPTIMYAGITWMVIMLVYKECLKECTQ